MKILAIDTTTNFLCLGICDGNKIYEYTLQTGRKLSSLLSVTVARVLDSLGWEVKDIDYFACGVGPGSFTGIRTGLASVKGMSWAVNKPVVGVVTLDILARNIKGGDSTIVTAIDARRSLIYCSVYRNRNTKTERISPYMLLNKDEFLRKIKPGSIILGDALDLYKDEILRKIKGTIAMDRDYWYPKPRNIIALAIQKIRLKKVNDAFSIKPVYLYAKECQIKK